MHPQLVQTSQPSDRDVPLPPPVVVVIVVIIVVAPATGASSTIIVIVVVIIVVRVVVHVGVVHRCNSAVDSAHNVYIDVNHGHEIQHEIHQEKGNGEEAKQSYT